MRGYVGDVPRYHRARSPLPGLTGFLRDFHKHAFAVLLAAATAIVPVHGVEISHRGSAYRIDYRVKVAAS